MLKKILLIFIGFILSLLLLEILLQTTSVILKLYKSQRIHYELNKKDAITIFCIGESTTKDQWPRFLEESLKARGVNKKIRIIDGGHGASNTDRLLSEIDRDLDMYSPSIIISMIGINDTIDIVKNITHSKSKVKVLMLLIKEHLKTKVNMSINGNDFDLNCKKAVMFFNQKKHKEAIKIYEYLNQKYPNKKLDFIHEWITNLNEMDNIKEIESIVLNTMEEYPDFKVSYVHVVAYMLCAVKNVKMLEELLPVDKPEILEPIIKNNIGEFLTLREDLLGLKMIDLVKFIDKVINKISSDKDVAEGQKRYFANILGFKYLSDFIQDDYKKADDGFKLQTDYLLNHIYPNTENNYRKLAQLCKDREIKLIAMQYPVRSIKPLQKMLKGFDDIVFVSNEENFKEKLKTTYYKDIFNDLFAGDFGHCTDLGNQMIADNLADTLVKLIN